LGGLVLDEENYKPPRLWVEYGEPGGCLFCYSAEGEVLYYDRGKWLSAATTIVN
jgi:hypothetical protein